MSNFPLITVLLGVLMTVLTSGAVAQQTSNAVGGDIVASPAPQAAPFADALTKRPIQPELENLARSLEGQARGGGSEALNSLAGKLALWQTLDAERERIRAKYLELAIAQYQSDANNAIITSIYAPLIIGASGLRADVSGLQASLTQVARALPDDRPVDARLKRFLGREGAAEAVYTSFIYPAFLGPSQADKLRDFLRPVGRGQFEISPAMRESVGRYFDSLQPVLDAVDQAARHNIEGAKAIIDSDAEHREVKALIRSPLTTAIIATLVLGAKPDLRGEELVRAIVAATFRYFEGDGDRLRLSQAARSQEYASGIGLMHRLYAVATSRRLALGLLREAIKSDDALHRRFRDLLAAPFVVASTTPPEALKPVHDVLLAHTPLGSALHASGSRWQVNPHRLREVSLALDHMESLLDQRQNIVARLARTRSSGTPVPSDPLAGIALVQAAASAAPREPKALIDAWQRDRGQSDSAQSDRARTLEQVQARQRRIESALQSDEQALVVELGKQHLSSDHISLFKSSTYGFLRTDEAKRIYFDEFPDHHAIRVWGTFDWSAQAATDLASYRQLMRATGPLLKQLAATHEKLIFYIFHTPKFLSPSKSEKDVDGRPAWLLYSPSDYERWTELVRESVSFIQSQIGDVDVYYEIWNEPEIYWLEGTDEYLEYYKQTARAVKDAHPRAKVGGAVVNGWEGRPKGSPNRDPLNFDLIDYVAREKLPLDFVSWHHFERAPADFTKAKEAYEMALRKAGIRKMPEFVVSEWSIPARGTVFEPTYFAEYMLAMYQAKVDVQTVAVWEEFASHARPDYFSPWGMITQQGYKKPMFHVHAFFDRISRDSRGIGHAQSADQRTKVVVSDKGSGIYELLIWELGYGRPLEAALKSLGASGIGEAKIKEYGTIAELERAIQSGKALRRGDDGAFAQARSAYAKHAGYQNIAHLELRGAKQIEVLDSATIGLKLTDRQAFTDGPHLAAAIDKNEVMWLRVRVR